MKKHSEGEIEKMMKEIEKKIEFYWNKSLKKISLRRSKGIKDKLIPKRRVKEKLKNCKIICIKASRN